MPVRAWTWLCSTLLMTADPDPDSILCDPVRAGDDHDFILFRFGNMIHAYLLERTDVTRRSWTVNP